MAHPNSHLFTLFIEFAKANVVPAGYVTWKDHCGVNCFRFVAQKQGWAIAPSVVDTAANIGAHSGWLNPDYTKAPIGAWHFWTNHVGQDLNGGGEIVAMATDAPLIWSIVPDLGVQSVPGYKYQGQHYLGWATQYGGGRTKYVEPTAETVPAEGSKPPVIVTPPPVIVVPPIVTPDPPVVVTPVPPVTVPPTTTVPPDPKPVPPTPLPKPAPEAKSAFQRFFEALLAAFRIK